MNFFLDALKKYLNSKKEYFFNKELIVTYNGK